MSMEIHVMAIHGKGVCEIAANWGCPTTCSTIHCRLWTVMRACLILC
jgi:hypothetical protein